MLSKYAEITLPAVIKEFVEGQSSEDLLDFFWPVVGSIRGEQNTSIERK